MLYRLESEDLFYIKPLRAGAGSLLPLPGVRGISAFAPASPPLGTTKTKGAEPLLNDSEARVAAAMLPTADVDLTDSQLRSMAPGTTAGHPPPSSSLTAAPLDSGPPIVRKGGVAEARRASSIDSIGNESNPVRGLRGTLT